VGQTSAFKSASRADGSKLMPKPPQMPKVSPKLSICKASLGAAAVKSSNTIQRPLVPKSAAPSAVPGLPSKPNMKAEGAAVPQKVVQKALGKSLYPMSKAKTQQPQPSPRGGAQKVDPAEKTAPRPPVQLPTRRPSLGSCSLAKSPSMDSFSPAPESPQPEGSPGESWKEFSDVDPVYALIGELGSNKVIRESGTVDDDLLKHYLARLLRPGGTRKLKDWVEVWATMNIPIDKQHEVLLAILEVGLASEVADTVPEILAELMKGHRVKNKAIEEAMTTIFEYGSDEQGCIARFFHLIFPKSPTSDWGWARVGWNWNQWWGATERVLNCLDSNSAFEVLRSILTSIETESGTYLPHQQMWCDARLAIVRSALCKYGGLTEDELPAAVDLLLS